MSHVPGPDFDLDALRAQVRSGEIDTVEIAAVDLQGRLQGRRLRADFFLERVLTAGQECQSYLLATDVEMSTPDGYAIASWQTGYGNLVLRPDLQSLRRAPWRDRTALVLSDVSWRDAGPVTVSPRQILRRQLERLEELGLVPYVGAELEFLLFTTTYRQAWQSGYRDLQPAGHFGDDFGLLETDTDGSFQRRLMEALAAAEVPFECLMNEANVGQHELVLRHAAALAACDNQAVARFAVKQVAASQNMSATFMPKFNEREGNACHLHVSLRTADGAPAFSGSGPNGFSPLLENFLAGQLAYLREFALLFAPNVNSYKRFVPGSYAPTAIAWGFDNRTCALRALGSGESLRFEHRVPGADVNPYIAVAAILAAGLLGIENALVLEAPFNGNAYNSDCPRIPASLSEAVTLFRSSATANKVFGQEVVEHYTRAAEVELEAFTGHVTDWERYRNFERL